MQKDGNTYRKARESRSRDYSDTTAIYEKAKESNHKSEALKKKKGEKDYNKKVHDSVMKDVYKQFPNIKINGKSPYEDRHKA